MSTKRKRKTLGSYPYFNVVFSNTMALLVIGVFGVLLLYSQRLTTLIKENVEMHIYLNKGITESARTRINKTLQGKDFILKKDGIAMIEYVSKEKAAESFTQKTKEDFVDFLGDNPLKDAYKINIDPAHQSTDGMMSIKSDLDGITGVFEVDYKPSLVEDIDKSIKKLSMFLLIPAAVLILAVVILINSSIKLALFSQRFLIRSMQLVGAKNVFIRKPFIIRAGGHGLLAGLIASLLLFLLTNFVNKEIAELNQLYNQNNMLILYGILIVTGVFIGMLSTQWSISRYLKMSLDELY